MAFQRLALQPSVNGSLNQSVAGNLRENAVAGGSFSGDDEHTDHCETTVLDLGSLEAELFLGVGVGDVAERVEGATRVAALVLVEFGRAREFEVAHEEDFDPGQGTDGEAREREAQVLRLFEFNLTGVRPGDAGGGFRDGGAGEAEHRPARVKEFALAEAVDVEGLVVRLLSSNKTSSIVSQSWFFLPLPSLDRARSYQIPYHIFLPDSDRSHHDDHIFEFTRRASVNATEKRG